MFFLFPPNRLSAFLVENFLKLVYRLFQVSFLKEALSRRGTLRTPRCINPPLVLNVRTTVFLNFPILVGSNGVGGDLAPTMAINPAVVLPASFLILSLPW